MRRTIVLVLALVIASHVSAQEAGLFITSKPIRAEVTLDGTPRGQTPLLVRDLEPGQHQLSIIKPGYVPATETVELSPGEYGTVAVTLEPNVFVGAFAATETEVAGTVYSRQDARLVLPAGTYEFAQSGTRLSLNPVYPNESALRSLRVATPVVLIAAAIATIEDLLIQDSARSFFTSRLPSPGTFASWTAAAASTGFLIALSRDKERYEAETVVQKLETELTEAEAESFYLTAETALAAGNFNTALSNYTRVILDGGDSEYVPLAMYKTGRIYTISGQGKLALPLFNLIVRDLPLPETYDRSLKSIADIYESEEYQEYETAIEALEQMVFADEFYDRATIDEDIQRLQELADGGTP